MKKIAFVKDETGLWTVWAPIFEQKGYDVVLLDIYSKSDQDRLLDEKWDSFIWRAKHDPRIKSLGKRFLAFFELERKIKTFPSFNDYFHYDDKISQYYILKANNIPIPQTYLFFNKKEALNFMEGEANLPLIFKSASGAGSSNVNLIDSRSKGKRYIKKAFGKGIDTYFKDEKQKFYVLFQEFLKNNNGDYKIICLGNQRVFGYYRENKSNKKFASGTENWRFEDLPQDLVKFIYEVQSRLNFPPVMSYDLLKDNKDRWVVSEFGVIFGDLSIWDRYTDSKGYEKDSNGKFVKTEINSISNDELFIDLLLKNWGWID